MTYPVDPAWAEANQRCLMGAIAEVQYRLQTPGQQVPSALTQWHTLVTELTPAPALVQMTQRFGLSEFEQAVLLLCAGMEIMNDWGELCATALGEGAPACPSFGLAKAVLPDPHWSAFLPASPLRHWQLIELGPSNSLLSAPLRIEERVLHGLLGFVDLDDDLMVLVQAVPPGVEVVPSHQALAQQMVQVWQGATTQCPPLIQLCGPDGAGQTALAAVACADLGCSLYQLSGRAVPTQDGDLRQVLRLWQRETRLGEVVLLLDWDQGASDPQRDNAKSLLVEALVGPVIILSRERRAFQRATITLDVATPTRPEQVQLWHHQLPTADSTTVQQLTSQFDLSQDQIYAAALQGRNAQPEGTLANNLWTACRRQARPRLDDLAQRLDPQETWDDLVLPDAQCQQLDDILIHVQQRIQVYETWGFGGKTSRGLGISALFAGTSGTGKTMAAGVLAQKLKLDLYRIDLSAVVSKYIGETEKNLARIFDAADSGGVILLFDEADALFGKRSEVKDSHDRYANLEVSYLLQRMEAYRGLAILTTNIKDAIDAAFLRRIRFVVRFPFPNYDERMKIWLRMFPTVLPTAELNYRQLAKLNVAGGTIRNIALGAAFLAAAEGTPLSMGHLHAAAQREFMKLERPLPLTEVKGWVDSSPGKV